MADQIPMVPFSESNLWKIQTDTYSREGIKAWENQLPFYITNNPCIASAYAEILARFMQDNKTAGTCTEGKPFYIIELGTGPGHFSYYTIKHLLEIRAQLHITDIPFVYVMTDFTEVNVGFWKTHPALQEFIKQGVLDFAVYDMEKPVEFELLISGKNIKDETGNPFIILANYVFDSVPHDVFCIDDHKLKLGIIEQSPDVHKQVTENRVKFGFKDLELPYYHDELLDGILKFHLENTDNCTFQVPVCSLRCIKEFMALSGNKLLLIISDKATSRYQLAPKNSFPDITFHGSYFSMMVNFQSIDYFFEQQKGDFFKQSEANREVLFTSAYLAGNTFSTLPETRYALETWLNNYYAADITRIHRELLASGSGRINTPGTLLSLLKLTQWDPFVIEQAVDLIQRIGQIQPVPVDVLIELSKGMAKVRDNFYYIPNGFDILAVIAVFFQELKNYKAAVHFYKQSAVYFGVNPAACFNRGICHYLGGEPADALEMFEKAAVLKPGYAAAGEWITRIKSEWGDAERLAAHKLPVLREQRYPLIPHLRAQGTAMQLVVHGKPFLVLGGELGNSSASDPDYMATVWPKAVAFNMNTVLAPVYWELIEPAEGRFDFTLVNDLINGARRHSLSLILLWFGAWKNSMSCYAPCWIKKDLDRFPRMVDGCGTGQEILSVFSESVLEADSCAFAALMGQLRKIDEKRNTVIMVQVENEIGMLPCARDMSETANRLYAGPVPAQLLSYLAGHSGTLGEKLRTQWESSGQRMAGTWEEVFGPGDATEEIFMAWHYAVFTDRLATAGKTVYPLPMYVNAALNRPGCQPGQYPSGGPLPHLFAIWKAGAPAIDFLAPDLYFPEYDEWISKYKCTDNPLFVPENQLGHFNGAHAVHTIGAYDAIGYCPFSVESCPEPLAMPLSSCNQALAALAPLILEKQGKGLTAGVLLSSPESCAERVLGGYGLRFRHELDWLKPAAPVPTGRMSAGCLVIASAPDQFIVMGSGILITFTPVEPGLPVAGFAAITEILVKGGKLKTGRCLNGDQNHQGRHVHLPGNEFVIQRVTLYRYR